MPCRTSAGTAICAAASSATRTRAPSSGQRNGRTSRHSEKCGSAARDRSSGTSGSPSAGGRRSTSARRAGRRRGGGQHPAAARAPAADGVRGPHRSGRPRRARRPVSGHAAGVDLPRCRRVVGGRGERAARSPPDSSWRNSGLRTSSSAAVPTSTTRPASRTAIRSARASVERRWATSSVVRLPAPSTSSRSAAWISRLDRGVDGGGRVVEHEHPRGEQQRAGQRDPLPLPAGEGEALLADDGVVAVGQRRDEAVGLRRRGPRRAPARRWRRAGRRRCWPGRCRRTGSSPRAPRRASAAATPVVQLADVAAADADRAGLARRRSAAAADHAGLARAGRADQGQRLPRLDGEGDPAQHRPDVGPVPEHHVVQLDRQRPVGRHRVGARRRAGTQVDDLQHPLHAGAGLLADGEDGGELAHRGDQRRQVGGEGQEGAEADRPAQGQPAAEREHADLAERGHRLQRRVVAGGEAGRRAAASRTAGGRRPPGGAARAPPARSP